MAEHVILFTGPMGAGKTTAIRSLSETDVISTEANNSERDVVDKPTTTVALDYGEIVLDTEDKIRMYGIPGQKRFDFMWTILKERARGMVLLVNNDAPDPIATMLDYLGEFEELVARGTVLIAISRTDAAPSPTIDDYSDALFEARPDLFLPIFTVDPRDLGQMTTLLLTLVATIDSRAQVTPEGMLS